MGRVSLLLTVVGAIVLAFSGVVLAQQTTPGSSRGGAPPETPTGKIPDRYIVVLDDDVSDDPGEVARRHANEHGLQAGFVYRHAIKGYSATIPNEQALQRVRNDGEVKYVEQDGVVNAVAQTLPWGIDKIDADTSSTKAGDGTGSVTNVNAYIIDSGVGTHGDLNKVGHVNFAGGKNDDCNGHGTHVAGTVAARDNTSAVVGVAPGAPLYGVKVLGCSGSGSWSGVIKGVDYVTGHDSGTNKKVANMSLGGGAVQSLDDAVRNSASKGVFYALAAGNDGADACNSSPARAGKDPVTGNKDNGIMTVAATNSSDAETSWSNYGSCVDIWAPGASILSTKRGGGTTTMSGTSMASPHGAGGGGLYLSNNTSTTDMSTVEAAVKSAATTTTNESKDSETTIVRESVGGFQ